MLKKLLIILPLLLLPVFLYASSESGAEMHLNATDHGLAQICVILFVLAYVLVIIEEFTHLRKSKPVILVAGIIWVLVAIVAKNQGMSEIASENLDHAILEYGELFLFLLTAMTYINTLEERHVFLALKSYLVNLGLSYRGVFWLTGIVAFCLSPIADNLTTALVMCTVVLAIGRDNPGFVCISCVNIVVAANAGGAFSPFGDITTLMVWQSGIVPFSTFFALFIPSLISFLVPATIMSFAISKHKPSSIKENTPMKVGAITVIILFLTTIITAVLFENFLHLPPALGMTTGLGYLMIYSYFITRRYRNFHEGNPAGPGGFDVFKKIRRAEWDTLLFFYGILVAVQGMATLGYLTVISNLIYTDMHSMAPMLFDNQTQANTIVGILSAIVDNIPVMYAVLTMMPHMSEGQWLLVTLTAGIGGSLLPVGSAAGVAVMGQANGIYTFLGHLKWIWAVALGYFAAIAAHLIINASYFSYYPEIIHI
ncbi:sodium:proton antiporter NhaD [Francisellaceae bacterium]|nr:sodium:proton antiporter NhaD [Francisellaceae bacterium]